MGYEPYPRRGRNDLWGNRDDVESRNYGYGYDADRDRYRSSAREFAAADDHFGDREYGRGRDSQGGRYGRSDERSRYGNSGGGYDRGYDEQRGYGAGGRSGGPQRGDYGRRPEGYDYQDRDFFSRAGDEVRSWFGDDEAERRREYDARYDRQHAHDDHYRGWRNRQIADLDRDYDEYRRENASRFENEFGSWRNERQTQRQSLQQVSEHMEVVGSDGEHVGTVDKVRGDRIILTKSDPDAGGHHHSIPSRWIQSVGDKITIRKTADEAKAAWRDEERSGAMFGDREQGNDRYLNRSFSGTY